MTPMTPVVPIIQTEPNKIYGKNKMKEKLIPNNIPSSLNENYENNHNKDAQIDLSIPMAFTFNDKFKENQSKTVTNNKINRINRINKFNKREISAKDNKKKNKNKTSLKIFIPYDNSIGDISTNGESYNTPMTPMTPVIQAMQTEPNKN